MAFSLPSLSRLSLREKIGQTCQIHGEDIAGLPESELPAYFEKNPVGSIFLGSEIIGSNGEGAARLRPLIANCQAASRIPLSIAGDLENGAGGAVRGLTSFPNLLALAAMMDSREAAYEYGRWTAVEACRLGFNWSFGPVTDLSLNWLNPIVSVRSLGDSPERVAELAGAILQGSQDHGLSSTVKHFPGDGVDFRDQHFCLTVNSLAEEAWWETFGRVFASCFARGVHAVMAGHIALPWIEKGTAQGGAPLPATTSPRILTELLRRRMGYEGVVVSDALIMAGFRGRSASHDELLIEAFNAGIDVLLWPGEGYIDLMERAVEEGKIHESRLNESVRRIFAMKSRHPALPESDRSATGETGARIFARRVAEGSLTLVENQRGLLPLDPATTRRVQILLATPREEGAHERLKPFTDGLAARGFLCEIHINGNCLDLRRREAAGLRFDALVVFFELWTHALKNTMRPTGPMAECMWTIQGLKTMHPIVIALGSPYLLHDMPWADTLVNAYSQNPHTLAALERALFGDIPFTGISPVATKPSWFEPTGLPFTARRDDRSEAVIA